MSGASRESAAMDGRRCMLEHRGVPNISCGYDTHLTRSLSVYTPTIYLVWIDSRVRTAMSEQTKNCSEKHQR